MLIGAGNTGNEAKIVKSSPVSLLLILKIIRNSSHNFFMSQTCWLLHHNQLLHLILIQYFVRKLLHIRWRVIFGGLLGPSLLDERKLGTWIVENDRKDLKIGRCVDFCELRYYFILS